MNNGYAQKVFLLQNISREQTISHENPGCHEQGTNTHAPLGGTTKDENRKLIFETNESGRAGREFRDRVLCLPWCLPWCLMGIMILLSAWFFPSPALAVDISKDITSDTVWTEKMSPYLIRDNITIDEGVTLTIEAGTVIKFQKPAKPADTSGGQSTSAPAGYHLKVNGTLKARGRDSKPILFTSEMRENSWGHIEFTEDSTAWDEDSECGCILSHCIIEYAGAGEDGGYGKAGVRAVLASPLIRENIIRYSKADGILIYSGKPHIMNNRIHDTVCGIKIKNPQGGLVENNYLIRNQQGIYLESGTEAIDIKNNTIENSSPEIFGGCLGLNLLYRNNLASCLWEQMAGPEVELSDPNSLKSTFTAPDVSDDEFLTFRLTVTDAGGLLAADTVAIKVRRENEGPTADAGPDQTVGEGAQVVLDGSNSLDPDGNVTAYAWELTSEPSDVTLLDANSPGCTFTAPTGVGPYGRTCIFEITVTDNGGLQSKDTTIIHVIEEDHDDGAPAVEAMAYVDANSPLKTLTVYEAGTVTLDGSISSDPNRIRSRLWWQIEGPHVEIHNNTMLQAYFTAPDDVGWEGESLVFQFMVTDDDLRQASDLVIVNVIDPNISTHNSPPSADAGLDQEVSEDDTTIYMTGAVNDPDGSSDIDTYAWKQIGGIPVNKPTGTTRDHSFQSPDIGKDEEVIFRFTVADDHGLKATDTIKITIKWVNETPVAEAGPDQTVAAGTRVLLDGSGSIDADDGLMSYKWEQKSGQPVALSSKLVVKPSFTAPSVSANEPLIFQLTVTDEHGAGSSDFVMVNIRPENNPPVADAGQDMAVAWGAPVTLDGTGSYDPEDPEDPNAISFLWAEANRPTVTLYAANTAQPHFTAPAKGAEEGSSGFKSLTFILTVMDKTWLVSSDSVIVNITDSLDQNQMPTAEAGPDQTVTAGAAVTLDGSGSLDPDAIPEILIRNNEFIQDDPNSTGNALAIRKDDPGARCHLSINTNNLKHLNGNFMVYLSAWAGEATGSVDMTGNWWGTTSSSEINSFIYDYDQDQYVPQVDTSSAKNVEISGVGSTLSYPPIAEAGEDREVEPDEAVTLDGSETHDPDSLMSYQWIQTEGQTVTLHGADKRSASFIAPLPEEEEDNGDSGEAVLKFRLTVTDAQGFADTDEVTVTIKTPEKDTSERTGSGCFISTITLKIQ